MELKKLQLLLENPNRICTLSTTDRQGNPNTAIFGSVQIRGEQITIGFSSNRSLTNLRQNPKATLLIVIPGDNIFAFQGARLYLECKSIENSGPLLEEIRATACLKAGSAAGRMIQHALSFDITDDRALVDLSSLFPAH